MLQIQAEKREAFGKQTVQVTSQGLIPAELYGRGFENIHLMVSVKEFNKMYSQAGESTVLNVIVDGEAHPVLVHDVQWDVMGDRIIHIDFYQVHMDEKITTEVPLNFIGEAPAIKEKEGVLVKAMEALEVEALPLDLPHSLDVDLSVLVDLHQSIHVKDIVIPKGVEVKVDPETVIATVTEKQAEEIIETPTPVEGEEGTTPAEGQPAVGEGEKEQTA